MKLDMTDGEFARLTRYLHDAAGLVFDDTRRDSLGYALGERLPCTPFTEVTSYLDHVMSRDGIDERQQLLDEVTIPETYFFRNPPQIRALGRQVLPELVRTNADTKRLVIWSAGCSTGEEPYTVAMLLLELIPDHKDWDIRIVATDVSQRALPEHHSVSAVEIVRRNVELALHLAEAAWQAMSLHETLEKLLVMSEGENAGR